jgi:hypothetical protein
MNIEQSLLVIVAEGQNRRDVFLKLQRAGELPPGNRRNYIAQHVLSFNFPLGLSNIKAAKTFNKISGIIASYNSLKLWRIGVICRNEIFQRAMIDGQK